MLNNRPISHSEIACYLDCEWKHDFKYNLRAEVRPEVTGKLLFGSAVHHGLEQYLRNKVPNPAGIAVQYAMARTIVEPKETLAIAAAVRAGMDFLAHQEPIEVLGVEERFERTFGDWRTTGSKDLVYRDAMGIAHVLDWKTTDPLPPDTTGQIDPQTVLYALDTMLSLGVDEIYAGRCYLRMAASAIKLTKSGHVNLTSSCSLADYVAYIEAHPLAAVDPQKAREKWGRWWSHHEDLLTRRFCERIVAQHAAAARRIRQKLRPLPNFRPKMCVHCEVSAQCLDRISNESTIFE